MLSLKEIKRRMRSIKDIHQVTKAMRMVSIVKLRKAENTLNISSERYQSLRRILIGKIKRLEKGETDRLIKESLNRKVTCLIVASNKGLCGAFNKNVFTRFQQLEKKLNISSAFIIGKKVFNFIRKKEIKIREQYLFPDRKFSYKFAYNLILKVLEAFEAGEIDTVKVIFNKNVSLMVQEAKVVQLVPVIPTERELNEVEELKHMCEPSDSILIRNLAKETIVAHLFYILEQSKVAEHTARMNAMEAASDNAQELLKELKHSYNKVRQTAITKEIIEIASTAEALKG